MNRRHRPIRRPAQPPRLPRRDRVFSAAASGVITAVLFASVVMGMTSMNDDDRTMAGDVPAAQRA